MLCQPLWEVQFIWLFALFNSKNPIWLHTVNVKSLQKLHHIKAYSVVGYQRFIKGYFSAFPLYWTVDNREWHMEEWKRGLTCHWEFQPDMNRACCHYLWLCLWHLRVYFVDNYCVSHLLIIYLNSTKTQTDICRLFIFSMWLPVYIVTALSVFNMFSLLSLNFLCQEFSWTITVCSWRFSICLLNGFLHVSSWTGICSWTGLSQLLLTWWGLGCMRLKEPCNRRSSSSKHMTWQLTLSTELWSSTRLAWSDTRKMQITEKKQWNTRANLNKGVG